MGLRRDRGIERTLMMVSLIRVFPSDSSIYPHCLPISTHYFLISNCLRNPTKTAIETTDVRFLRPAYRH